MTTDIDPYSLTVDLSVRGLTDGEALAGLTACMDALPPFHPDRAGADYTVTVHRSDLGRAGTDASRRFTITAPAISIVVAQIALEEIRGVLDGYGKDDDSQEVAA